MLKYRIVYTDAEGNTLGIYTGEVANTGKVNLDLVDSKTLSIEWEEVTDGNYSLNKPGPY
jgi:hypothetical protein